MMNRLLIKRLFFAFTPVYAPYCPPFAKKNELLSTKSSFFFYPSRRLGISSRVSVYIIAVGAYHQPEAVLTAA